METEISYVIMNDLVFLFMFFGGFLCVCFLYFLVEFCKCLYSIINKKVWIKTLNP